MSKFLTEALISNVDDEAKHLAVFLQNTLDRVLAIYESYSVPVPDRVYWTLGQPAEDCEQLVVSFIQMYLGMPGDEATEPRRCNDPRVATVNVQVSRTVPIVSSNGRPPTPEAIQLHSNLVAYDAWVLMDSINQLDAWSDVDPLGLGVIGTINVAAPQGGLHTTVLTLTVAVP
jgi:hypothetical protein